MLSTMDEVTTRKICILVGIERVRLNTPISDRQYPPLYWKNINHYIDELFKNPSRLDELWTSYQDGMHNYWGRMESWSVVEAALVSLEIDPREINKLKKPLKYHTVPCLKDYFETKIANEYLDRVDLIASKYQLVEVEHPPIEYLEWFESKEIEFPQACAMNIRKYYQVEDYKKLFEAEQLVSNNLKVEHDRYKEEAGKAIKSKAAQSKEINNLKVVTHLLAKKAFPNLPNDGNYTSKIIDHLHKQGFSISEETIRGYYKEGKTLFNKNAVKE